MIHEVDGSIRDLMLRESLDGSDVEVVFDAPTKEWAARQSAPCVNAFLYDIREDMGRRDYAPRQIRNDEGRVVARHPPPRRFRLSYLLTAWTQRPEDEHRLLSRLLAGLIRFEELPDDVLQGGLALQDLPVIMSISLPPPPERSLSDIWSALGGELKPSLDLVVVAPLEPGRAFEAGPPVLEEPRLQMAGDPGASRSKRARKKQAARRPAAVPHPDLAGAEDVQAGRDDRPGRTLHVRRHPTE